MDITDIVRSLLQAEEEVRGLQKKIQQIENELDQVQESLATANNSLEEKDKALAAVSIKKTSYVKFKTKPLLASRDSPFNHFFEARKA